MTNTKTDYEICDEIGDWWITETWSRGIEDSTLTDEQRVVIANDILSQYGCTFRVTAVDSSNVQCFTWTIKE